MKLAGQKYIFLFFLTLALINFETPAQGANWLTLIGTEPPEQTYKLWGVIQPLYTYDFGDRLENLREKGILDQGRRQKNDRNHFRHYLSLYPWNQDDRELYLP